MIVLRQLSFWQRTLVNAIVFMAISGFFPAMFRVDSPWIAILAALLLGLLNMLVKPILLLIALPITFVTLGLFYFVINGLMLELTAWLIGSGFQFSGFGSAFLVALILSVVNLIITNYFSRIS